MENLEPTVDLGGRENSASGNANTFSLSPIAKLEGSPSGVTGHFAEDTRVLLRNRLIVAAATALIFLLAIKLLSFTFDSFRWSDLLTRLTAVFVLSATLLYLYKNEKVGLFLLRIFEIVVFAIPIAEALLILVQEVQKRTVTGQLVEIPALFALISFAIAIFIAIYGMFIPTNWKRTLVIAGIAAISPAVVALVHQCFIDGVSFADYPGAIAPLMAIMMAAVAVQAAHVVHTVRRQAAEAKMYGQYQLTEKIGEGGMGVVYQAKHRMLKRPAAIKLIRTEMAHNMKSVADFEHEVQLSASLTHWNTVQIYDYGRTDDGEFYYVMECLSGETLEQRIRDGRLSNEDTVQIIGQVCDGLEEAHSKGMIHRDIKPANIFLTQVADHKDVVKILDFGLAAMKGEMDLLQSVSGTPQYMSPEQVKGTNVDNRTDIYALGCVIYECLAGHRLFEGGSISDLLYLQVNKKPLLHKLPDSAANFADVIEMCTAKDSEQRFKSVMALKKAMSSMLPVS